MANDYLKIIKKKISEKNIDEDTIILGKGCVVRKDNRYPARKGRYVLQTSLADEKVKYVIQYCKDINQYIAWKNLDVIHKGNFSVKAESIPRVAVDEILSTKKGIEFEWNAKEDVYTFKEEGIDSFLETIVKSE